MITIYIDEQAYQVEEGKNLLETCLSLKLDLPYFCWHPAMDSVGACRQCAMTQYQDENDQRGRLIVACMTNVTEGMRVSMQGPAETDFRKQVIATLMTNHPHDCPVCAEGGECHLQDMTVMTGHRNRQYQGKKRTYQNQDLGPLIHHEMNRCITCYRCERFYVNYAGGTDFAAQGSKNQVYFGRHQDGILENEFAGNLCEVCPTGVFTDKPFGQHYSRKWDLSSAPSICPHCSAGCNISYQERYGSVRRVVNRYKKELNGYFICDRGRFGHGYANIEDRVSGILVHGQDNKIQFDHPQLQANLNQAKNLPFFALGIPTSSLETHFLLKQLVGAKRYCPGLTHDQLELLRQHKQILEQISAPSIEEIEQADCIVILNEDVSTTSPRIALAIRQALTNKGREKAASLGIPSWQDSAIQLLVKSHPVPMFVLSDGTNHTLSLATNAIHLTKQDGVNVLNAVCNKFDATTQSLGFDENSLSEYQTEIETLYQTLLKAKRPLILAGWQQNQVNDLRVTANLYKALNNDEAMLCLIPEHSNSLGLAAFVDDKTLSTEQLLSGVNHEQHNCGLLLCEAELKEHFDQISVNQVLNQPEVVIQISSVETEQTEFCHLTLPSALYTEQDGHIVNYEGRLQPFYAAVQPPSLSLPAWHWLSKLRSIWGISNDRSNKNQSNKNQLNHRALCESLFKALNLKTELPSTFPKFKVAKGTPRSSGRTAMLANQTVHEPKPIQNTTSPYSFTMEGLLAGHPEAKNDSPFSWAPGWNSNQSVHKFQHESQTEKQDNDTRLFTGDKAVTHWPLAEKSLEIPSGNLSPVIISKVFGSESLSLATPELTDLTDAPFITLNPEQLKQRQLQVGDLVICQSRAHNWIAEVRADLLLSQSSVGVFLPQYEQYRFRLAPSMTLTKANEEQNKEFRQQQITLRAATQYTKSSRLQRLRQQDGNIPITFISEGGTS